MFSLRATSADIGISKKSGEHLYYPSGAHHYLIGDERELNGAAQCMLVDMEKSRWPKRLNLIVTKGTECLHAFKHLAGT